MKNRRYFGVALTALIAALFLAIHFSNAGTLTPSSAPDSNFYTLQAIYNRLVNSSTTTLAGHDFSPSTAPTTGTMRTLQEIYELIPTIDPGTVVSGTTYLGIAGLFPSENYLLTGASSTIGDLFASGTYLGITSGAVEWWTSSGTYQYADLDFPSIDSVCANDTLNGVTGTLTLLPESIVDSFTYCGVAGTATTGTVSGPDLTDMFNGGNSGDGYPGGSQANGGVDDQGASDGNAYEGNWTDCTAGNNYCGTGLSSADARDDDTGLIWSLPCSGVGCASFTSDIGSVGGNYTWDDSGAENSSLSAAQMCASGAHGQSGWSMPHQRQLMQAYINGAISNLTLADEYYAANTSVSYNPADNHWTVNLVQGATWTNQKDADPCCTIRVRCVR